jgi:predicted nucleic acid-binding protein
MHDFRSGIFRPVVSEIVALEMEDAPTLVQETYEDLLRLNPDVLEVDEEEALLADQYLERGILSGNYYDDAQHIALATVANVDVLASWNFQHIVHFDKIRQFNAVNLEQGYKPIDIRSPREVTHHGDRFGGNGQRD